jgi:Lon protease-like protein
VALSTQSLPLFPLDVVLFPGMVLPLHIFEQRYRRMVRDCLRNGQPFGLVWSEQEPLDVSGTSRLVGTTARITESEPLPDGRLNITTVGGERFQVHSLTHAEPYLMGHVEPFPLKQRHTTSVLQLTRQLMPLLTDYLELLNRIANRDLGPERMPADHTMLAYVVAVYYQCQNWRKQELLMIESLPELMHREIELLRVEIPLIRDTLARQAEGRLPSLFGGTMATYSLN